MGKIEVLDTPSGKILKALVKSGVKLGISSRGLGSVKEVRGDTMVEEDFQLICFDIVSEPSTPGAFLDKQAGPSKMPMSVSMSPEIGKYINESKETKIDGLFKSILGD